MAITEESYQPEGLSPEQLNAATEFYTNYRNLNDQAIRVGIFGDDLVRALESPETVFIQQQVNDTEKVATPILVPLEILEWYNLELLKKTYGEDVKAFYYAHPPINDKETYDKIAELLRSRLEDGAVIITDVYADDTTSPMAHLLEEAKGGQYGVEAFGGETESRVDVFAGPVTVNGESQIKAAPSLYEVYDELVQKDALERNPQNGTSLASVIEGDEAEEIWKIYENPFEDLGKDDPTLAGFDKETLLEILKDPGVVKVVNRVDGEITTLCIFLQDFEKAPWFNKKFFEMNYLEYAATDNIFMFPGIVSDESKRGNNYAMDVINLATHLLAKRGSSFLVTFECTEISTTYIPKIVTGAVNASGEAEITGLDEPISVINYYAVKKN